MAARDTAQEVPDEAGPAPAMGSVTKLDLGRASPADRPEAADGDDDYSDQDTGEMPEDFVDDLKPGVRLLHGQYTVLRYLNSGGFGITYLAKDSLDRTVVIKECFPGAFCRRSNTIVRARSRAHHAEFRSVVRLFVQEARQLSKLTHPNIVGVHQVFEDNDTAYMAIDYIEGRDLLDTIEKDPVSLTPEKVVNHLTKLLGAVGFIHESGVLHRDISPDNILINRNFEPILIDFGAAREQASKASRALSALRVVKDGYSPQEFYISGSTQGPSSDLYALAATFYHVIAGEAPPDSQRRLAAIADETGDPYVPLAGRIPGYPDGFLEALDKALSVLPRDRIATAAEWLNMIEGGVRVAKSNADVGRVSEIERAVSRLVDADATEAAAAAAATETPVPPVSAPARASQAAAQPAAAAPLSAPRPPRRGGKIVALLGAAATVAATGAYFVMRPDTPAPDVATPASLSAVTPAPIAGQGAETGSDTPAVAAQTDAAEAAAAAAIAAAETAAEEEAAAEAAARAAAEQVAAERAAAEAAAQAAAERAAAEKAAEERAAAEREAAERAEAERLAAEQAAAERAASERAEAERAAAERAAAERAEAERAAAEKAAAEAAAAVPVRRDQIAQTAWELALPFETRPIRIGADTFPVVSAVQPAALVPGRNDWLREGVILFAVNEEWVSDQSAIAELMRAQPSIDDAGFVSASVRIRTTADGPFEHVSLAIPATRFVTLANGVGFRTDWVDGSWLTVVTEVATEAEGGLQPGDILVAENTTGQTLESSLSLESVVDRLAREQRPEAAFTITRDGAVAVAVMPLLLE